MKAIFVITPEGKVTKTVQTGKPGLKFLQTAVGGYIEIVPHFTGFTYEGKRYSRGTAYCNEEGKLKQLDPNIRATAAWLACLGKGPFRYTPELYGPVVFYATEIA